MAILLFIATIIGAFWGIAIAWRQLATSRRQGPEATWRWYASVAAVIAATGQAFLFVSFEAYGQLIGGFSHSYRVFYAWGRLSGALFIVTLVSALLGNARFRLAALISSVALEVAWFILALAQ